MKRFVWRWLVVSSLIAASCAAAATRPQYGGTLRISLHSVLTTLDPADPASPDSFSQRNITSLVFENLVGFDDTGRLRPELATSWQATAGNQRWQFQLRGGIKVHDGTLLTAEVAASSLRSANPSWRVTAQAEQVIIESDSPNLDLPAQLALPRNAIVVKGGSGSLSGTGPFRIADWQAGKKLSLAANEDYWRGRPFLDAIEIELGKSSHDAQLAFEAGRTDLVEVPPEQLHRVSLEGRHVVSSQPIELLALLFTREPQSTEEQGLREALALCIERSSIRSVLLQGAGQPSASILPTWMSGYGFVFPAATNVAQARHLREQVRVLPTWTLGYDSNDGVERILAERVALNARDAGLNVQPTTNNSTDIRVVRISLTSDARVSLANIAALAGLPAPKFNAERAEDLYAVESSMLSSRKLIPLFHLPVSYSCAPALKNCVVSASAKWDLADTWFETTTQ